MNCPYCGKEIKDGAVFCGFCGKQVSPKPLEEAISSPPSDSIKKEVTKSSDNAPTEVVEETAKKAKGKSKKKHTAVKVLFVFVLLAFIGGGVLGFLTARGVVSIKSLLPNSSFKWTNFSEGQTETTETAETSDGKEDEKKNSSETTFPDDNEENTTPSTEPTDSSSKSASPEETQQPIESNPHYAKYVGNSFVVIDDKAHIWEEATIANILANAKTMSELSGYSIIVVVTNDMLNMTSQEFTDDYFDYVLNSNKRDTELIANGYLFLINLVDREFYLSTCGKAIDVYTDTAMDELFNKIQQFMVDENYEAAVNKVIEKTIY